MTQRWHSEPERDEDEMTIVAHADDLHGILFASPFFYPQGGGQPGDSGIFHPSDGGPSVAIETTVYSRPSGLVVHRVSQGVSLPLVGTRGRLVLDRVHRDLHSRVHTALHLLSVALPYEVTGGAIGAGTGRLDFNIVDANLIDREAIVAQINGWVEAGLFVREKWISDAELDANPGLIKTKAVKPPRGTGWVRLIEIDGIDLQPCGGTHVVSTDCIGPVEVVKVEKKGSQNRRVKIRLTT